MLNIGNIVYAKQFPAKLPAGACTQLFISHPSMHNFQDIFVGCLTDHFCGFKVERG